MPEKPAIDPEELQLAMEAVAGFANSLRNMARHLSETVAPAMESLAEQVRASMDEISGRADG